VIYLSKIWPDLFSAIKALTNVKLGVRVFVASLFLYAQAASATHAPEHLHEHHHENHDEEHQSVCQICIIATTDEDVPIDELDDPNAADGSQGIDFTHPQSLDQCYAQDGKTDVTNDTELIFKASERSTVTARAPPHPSY